MNESAERRHQLLKDGMGQLDARLIDIGCAPRGTVARQKAIAVLRRELD